MKADPREPGTFPDLEKEFEPNILNSTVYMISMSLQVATFAINYRYTVEFHRLGQCSIDWATAVVGEADRELTRVTLIYHSSGPIYETSAQSTKSPGKFLGLALNAIEEKKHAEK